MTKENRKPCLVSQLEVGDVFARNTMTREAFEVERILPDGTREAKIRGKHQLYPTKFRKDNHVIYLRHNNEKK